MPMRLWSALTQSLSSSGLALRLLGLPTSFESYSRDSGKEHGNYYIILGYIYWGYGSCRDNGKRKMETTILGRFHFESKRKAFKKQL